MLITDAAVGDRFARSLLAKDWASIAGVLGADIDFRGLTPGRQWEAHTRDEVIDGVFKQWFEPSDEIYEVLDVASDRVVDRGRVVYRARIRNPDGDFVCEQTAYYDTEDDRITKLRILCSGFLPSAGRSAS
jgi:hypothetical protein